MKTNFPVGPAILALLVLLCLVGGLRNYNALLNADQYSYLTYGRALARGGFAVDFPLQDLLRERLPDGVQRPLFYGRRFYSDGEIISTLEPGFPLLLAVAIRLGGLPAAFGVNVLLLSVFLISYFLVLRGEDPGRSPVALAAVFILLSWDSHIVIGYSLNLMRDIPAVTFFWLGLGLLLKSLRPEGRIFPGLFFGAAALAASGLIRLTNLVIILPLTIYALLAIRGKGWGWGKIFFTAAAAAAVFGLVFLPQAVEEALFFGDPISFARRALGAFGGFFRPGPAGSPHTFSLQNLGDNLPRNLSSIYSVISLAGVLLLAAGIFSARRRLTTWLIMLPVPLIQLLLFSAYGHRARRYRFPLYPFIAYFIARGAIWVFNRWRLSRSKLPPPAGAAASLISALAAGAFFGLRLAAGSGMDYVDIFLLSFILAALLPAAFLRRPWRPAPEAVFTAGTGLLLVPFLLGMVTRSWSFNWSDVQRLKAAIESCVPADAIILGRRYLIQNVDAYTHAHGISPGNLTAVLDVDLARAVVIVEDSGRPVYALDNRGYRSMEGEIREMSRYFDLEPVCRWPSAELKIDNPYYSSGEELSLFRVARRRRTATVVDLPTPRKVDYLVLFDTGLPPVPDGPAGETRVEVEGREIPVEFGSGLNYLLISAEDISPPDTALSVAFYRPLPAQPIRGLFPIARKFRVDFGVEGDPDDELFVLHGLYLDRHRRRTYRVMGPEAGAILPRVIPPGRNGGLKIRVKNLLGGGSPVNLSLRPDGARVFGRTIPDDGEWHLLKVPIRGRSPRQGSFTLELIARPVLTGPEAEDELAGRAFLAIDWLEISWGKASPGTPEAD